MIKKHKKNKKGVNCIKHTKKAKDAKKTGGFKSRGGVFLMVVMITIVLFSLNFVSAVRLDYSSNKNGINDMKVEVKDTIIFGLIATGTQGTMELVSHKTPIERRVIEINERLDEKSVAYGSIALIYDMDFIKRIPDGLSDVKIIDMKTGKEIKRDWRFVYAEYVQVEHPIYKEVCPLKEGKGIEGKNSQEDEEDDYLWRRENCERVFDYYENMTQKVWRIYEGQDIPIGKMELGIELVVEKGDYLDVVLEIQGKKISKHANVIEGIADYIYVGGYINTSVIKFDNDFNVVAVSPTADGIEAIGIDGDFVYFTGNTNKLRKAFKGNLSTIVESSNYGGNIYSIALDDNYVYIVGTTKKVWKLWKTNLTKITESPDYDGYIVDVVIDDDFVYYAGSTNTIIKAFKSNLSTILSSPNYGEIICGIALDNDYVYSVTRNGYARKAFKSNLTTIVSSESIGSILYPEINLDNNYAYFGVGGNKIRKVFKSNLTTVTTSVSYGDKNVRGIVNDNNFVYFVTEGSQYEQGGVWKVWKTNLTHVANLSNSLVKNPATLALEQIPYGQIDLNLISPENNSIIKSDSVNFSVGINSSGLNVNNVSLVINGAIVETLEFGGSIPEGFTKINTIEDLNNSLRVNQSGNYVLTRDLDFNDCDSYANCNNMAYFQAGSFPRINDFSGIFDGNGYTISNFYTLTPMIRISNPGIFKNVIFQNFTLNGWGGLIHFNFGYIENVYVNGTVNSSNPSTAGVLCLANLGTINRSSSSGYARSGSVNSAGGFCGLNEGLILDSYSNATSAGSTTRGGLVGSNSAGGIIVNSYASGFVGSQGGGLVGHSSGGQTITNSFWDTQTSDISTSVGGTGKTTAQMKNIQTYLDAEWDIVLKENWNGETWYIENGTDYPKLGWTLEQKTPFSDGIYNFSVHLQDGLYNWTIIAYDDENKIYETETRFLTVNVTPISLKFITPPTPVNYANITDKNFTIEVDVDYVSTTFTNITYTMENINGTTHNLFFTNPNYSVNYILPDAQFNYNVTVCGHYYKNNKDICVTTETRHLNHDTILPYFYVGGSKKVVIKYDRNFNIVAISPDYGDYIRSIIPDDDYIYYGGDTGIIRKAFKSNLSTITDSPDYGDYIRSIITDDDYIYYGGDTGIIRKAFKSNLSTITDSPDYEGYIWSIKVDDNYVYYGGQTLNYLGPNKVIKAFKSNLSTIVDSPDYGGSILDVVIDDDFVYYGGATTKKVRKAFKSNLTTIDESVDYGGFNIEIPSISIDNNYIYYGWDSIIVRKAFKSDLTNITDSPNYDSNIHSIINDDNYIYYGGDKGIIVKAFKNNLTTIDESVDYGGAIWSMAIEGLPPIPKITLTSPTNYYNSKIPLTSFMGQVKNYALDLIEITNVSLIINNTIKTTNISGMGGTYQFIENLPDGFYEWTMIVYDNLDRLSTTETRFLKQDTILPQFIITENNNIMNLNVNHIIKFEVTDINLDEVWFEYNGNNNTLNGVTSGVEATFDFIVNPNELNLVIYANDTAGNLGYKEVVLTLDQIIPTINYDSDIIFDISQNQTINTTITDDNLDKCWYDYKGANITFNCQSFNFGVDLNELNLVIYANDTVGNQNYANVLLVLDPTPPQITLLSGDEIKDYGVTGFYHEINFIVEDDNLDEVWYEYNGSNKSAMEMYIKDLTEDSGFTTTSFVLRKTLNIDNYLKNVTTELKSSSGSYSKEIRQDITYKNGTTISQTNSTSSTTYIPFTFINPNPQEEVEKVEIWAREVSTSGTGYIRNSIAIIPAKFIYPNGLISFPLEKGLYTATIYANDTAGNLKYKIVEWDYNAFENDMIFNPITYETKNENFFMNLSLRENIDISQVKLVYNGTSYSVTNITKKDGFVYLSKNIDIPLGKKNNEVYFEFKYKGDTIKTEKLHIQNVSLTQFGFCSAPLTVPYINITFKDENTLTPINGIIQSSIFNYYLGEGSVYKTYYYNNPNSSASYKFCASPPNQTYFVTPEINYLSNGYVTRIYNPGTIKLTNVTTDTLLYLLSNQDGNYVTFITATTSNTPIPQVNIKIERKIEGVSIIVFEGITDSAGAVTAWLNHNYEHTITASKTGYTTNIQTIKPTQSQYTLTMETGFDDYKYLSKRKGLKWFSFPGNGQVKEEENEFGFNITSQYDNIERCKIELLTHNRSIIITSAETITTNKSMCSVSVPYDMEINKIRGRLLVDIGEGYVILEDDAFWRLIKYNTTGSTMMDWFKGLNILELSYFNNDEDHREYTYILIFFLIVAIICASLNRLGWDIQTNGGMIFLIGILVWLASIPGFLTLKNISVIQFPILDQYYVAIVYTLFMIGFGVREFT